MRQIDEGKLHWRTSFRQSCERFVIDPKSGEQAQAATNSGNRSQNRHDHQANVGKHRASLNAQPIREGLRLTKLHGHRQGAAERKNTTLVQL